MVDERLANLWIHFFESKLTGTKGQYARKPFILAPWQRTIIRDLFGTVTKSGTRQYSTAYVEVPKKNGKSSLAAGIALGGLLIDNEEGAEIYSAASSREQASIVFRVAAQMVRNDPELDDLCRIIDSTKTIYLRDDPNCFYRAISADSGTQDGLNPHFVVFDELHRQKNRDLWDVLTMGSDTRTQPLTFAITTAGISGESPLCWEQHEYARQILQGVFKDPSFYPVLYGLPETADWTFEGEPAQVDKRGVVLAPATGWYSANPALGDFLRIDKVRDACEKAKRIPAEQNSFRRLRLNQWVAQETRWLDLHEWDACGAPFNANDLVGKKCVAGLDLSSTQDISALVLLFPIEAELFVLPFFWLPAKDKDGNGDIEQRSIRDRVTYDLWAKQGLLELTDGNFVDYGFIRERINRLASVYDIREIAADPWNAQQLLTDLKSDGQTVVAVRQGFASLSGPSKELERRVLGRTLRHGGHPILRWMADSVTVIQDPAGNIKPAKPDRLKSKKRIDGIAALVTGLSRLILEDTSTLTYTGANQLG